MLFLCYFSEIKVESGEKEYENRTIRSFGRWEKASGYVRSFKKPMGGLNSGRNRLNGCLSSLFGLFFPNDHMVTPSNDFFAAAFFILKPFFFSGAPHPLHSDFIPAVKRRRCSRISAVLSLNYITVRSTAVKRSDLDKWKKKVIKSKVIGGMSGIHWKIKIVKRFTLHFWLVGRTNPLGRAAEQIGRDRQFPSALRNQLRNRNKKQDGGVEKKLHTRGGSIQRAQSTNARIADVSVCVWEDSATFSAEIRKNGFIFCFFKKRRQIWNWNFDDW